MNDSLMKAAVYQRYGPPEVLELKEVKKPLLKDDEVLVKIYAATVTAGDCEVRSFKFPLLFWLPLRLMFGITGPRMPILGQEFSGEIVAVGKNVKRFKKGDSIFAATNNFGAYAEYKSHKSDFAIAIKPGNMSYEEATTIPTGGLNALYFLRKGNIQPGHKVLINGAGGSIGTYAIQLARYWGAEVTAVDSTAKLEMLRSIGADAVIDYTREDFTRNGKTYDLILDIVGKSPHRRSLKSLNPHGRYILAIPELSRMLRGLWTCMTSNKKVITGVADYHLEDMDYLKELIEAGHLKAVIDKRYPLENIVEAHRYVDSGLKKGNVIINIQPSD